METDPKQTPPLGMAIVFATHDPKVLDAARRVVHLVDGRIASDERRR